MSLLNIFNRFAKEERSNELVSHLGKSCISCLTYGGALAAIFMGAAALPLLLPVALGMGAGLAGIKVAYGSYSMARYG